MKLLKELKTLERYCNLTMLKLGILRNYLLTLMRVARVAISISRTTRPKQFISDGDMIVAIKCTDCWPRKHCILLENNFCYGKSLEELFPEIKRDTLASKGKETGRVRKGYLSRNS